MLILDRQLKAAKNDVSCVGLTRNTIIIVFTFGQEQRSVMYDLFFASSLIQQKQEKIHHMMQNSIFSNNNMCLYRNEKVHPLLVWLATLCIIFYYQTLPKMLLPPCF